MFKSCTNLYFRDRIVIDFKMSEVDKAGYKGVEESQPDVPDQIIESTAAAVESVNITVNDHAVHKSASASASKPAAEPMNADERKGLTTDEVEKLYEQWGFNELPVIEIPLWKVFIQQFMGTMPYMLELAIIISAAVQDWADFGIIIAMVKIIIFYEIKI